MSHKSVFFLSRDMIKVTIFRVTFFFFHYRDLLWRLCNNKFIEGLCTLPVLFFLKRWTFDHFSPLLLLLFHISNLCIIRLIKTYPKTRGELLFVWYMLIYQTCYIYMAIYFLIYLLDLYVYLILVRIRANCYWDLGKNIDSCNHCTNYSSNWICMATI